MTLCLIAGKGYLPKEFVDFAKQKGEEVFVVGVKGITDLAPVHETISIGKVGKLIKILKKESVKKIVMLGKFEPKLLYTSIFQFDTKAFQILRRAGDRKPATLIRTFMEVLEEEGFEFVDPKPYLQPLLAEEGQMTRKKPSVEALEDGRFAFPIAKEIAQLDVGQTLVVKNRAVVAVEAMEGTQETIRRGAKIAGKGIRVVKVARKKQDFRIDVPVVGLETLELLREVKADALFLEAGKVYISRKEEFLKLADRWGIPVVGLAWEKVGETTVGK